VPDTFIVPVNVPGEWPAGTATVTVMDTLPEREDMDDGEKETVKFWQATPDSQTGIIPMTGTFPVELRVIVVEFDLSCRMFMSSCVSTMFRMGLGATVMFSTVVFWLVVLSAFIQVTTADNR